MAKKIKFATDIPWREFNSTPGITKSNYRYHTGSTLFERNVVFITMSVVGFCTIYEKGKVKGKSALRIDMNTYDMPNVDVYICLECTDFVGRYYYIITTAEVDKYLLALSTSGAMYIVNSDVVYESSQHKLNICDIAQEDRRLLKMAIDEWSEQFVE